jgi:hypothetical protein
MNKKERAESQRHGLNEEKTALGLDFPLDNPLDSLTGDRGLKFQVSSFQFAVMCEKTLQSPHVCMYVQGWAKDWP